MNVKFGQVIYNPRLLPGFRLADGENIERFWSHLGQFSYITREMTASNRRDLLVDAMLHLGDKAMRNMGPIKKGHTFLLKSCVFCSMKNQRKY